MANAKFMGWEKGTEKRGTYCSQKSTDNFGNCGSAANVADSKIQRCRKAGELRRDESSKWITGSSQKMADANGKRQQEQHPATEPDQARQHPRSHASEWGGTWWDSEPDVGRVANGVAARVDRLKAIGNGQVPLVAATAWNLLSRP